MYHIPLIDWNILNQALYYYQLNGYKYIDTPWIIKPEINAITLPQEKLKVKLKFEISKTVGSGEQSFIQLIMDKNLPPGKYVTLTPCFRDEKKYDNLHHPCFAKVELLIIPSLEDNLIKHRNSMLTTAQRFFNQYLNNIVVNGYDEYDGIDWNANELDLLYYNQNKKDIELGSYGIRDLPDGFGKIIYGTGVAEPRFSYCIGLNNPNIKSGYHKTLIPKGELGQFSKIIEEMEELKDAHLQNNSIMEMVEISDLIGAIEAYLKPKNISIEDVIKMTRVTQEAFQSGRRS